HQHFKGREFMDHQCFLFFILSGNLALNSPKYVNPFRKVTKNIHFELDDQFKGYMNAINDSVSYINNSRKMTFMPLDPKDILKVTDDYFNGFNEGFATDILLDRSKVTFGKNYFDVLAINSELCFGDTVQSSKT